MIVKKIGLFLKLILNIIGAIIKSIFISKKDKFTYKASTSKAIYTAGSGQSVKWEDMYNGNELFCKSCHAVDGTKRNMPGSILIELVLWLCFIVPGLIYSLWRHSATKQVCSSCGSKEIIPISSPLAKQLLSKIHG